MQKSKKHLPVYRGRPRDSNLNKEITKVLWKLLENKSLAELTINEIALKAKTTRPAIYRRWSSIEEICIDAFLAEVEQKVPTPTSNHPPDALREYILSLIKFLSGQVGKVIAEILGRAQVSPELMRKFHDGFLKPRRNHARQIIRRGQKSNHFRSDIDFDLLIDLYAGPIYFRAFAQHAPLNDKFAQELADTVLVAIKKEKSK